MLALLLMGTVELVGCAGDAGRVGDDDAQSSGGNGPSMTPSSGAYKVACSDFCSLRQQAACNTTETHADCLAACSEDANLEENCESEFTALVSCGTGAPMACTGDAARITLDCSAQSSAYQRCMDANGWVSLSLEPCDVYSCQGLCHIAFGCVECIENTDCAPTEECSLGGNVCRQRCLADTDCPGAFCAASGVCGDPIGTPCEGFSDCEGGRCIDVDANLTTVDAYCTVSCVIDPCPEGYTCQENECRRLLP